MTGNDMAEGWMVNRLMYDTVKDFTPLGLIVDVPAGVVVHPSLPVKTVEEFIDFAKAHPGELNYEWRKVIRDASIPPQ